MAQAFFRIASKVHLALYRLSKGRGPFGRVGGKPVLLLTTIGRRSGKERTTPLTYFTDGDALVVVASSMAAPGHPAWFRNLEREPRVRIRTGAGEREMIAAEAPPSERSRLWERACEVFPDYEQHQHKVERVIPVVVLRPPPDVPVERLRD